ncbi:TetR/AcrR family transcriptional regulator [Enemella evansiae]|uniref:TetR/AcrR family transcriptional regulator n=1 Tax=Enemella evansiae TaxID=2016499 RepID=UPI000B95F059|nr:TetR family transcriptional regulator [Enemella evansiae]OYO06290.1 TetR family transcriptional regulator [Enemella evansiae]
MAQQQTANLGRRDPEGRRRAIVAAATELILEQGSGNLTHRAVATRSGVSLGSTTRYFPSIDELRAAALRSLADGIDESIDELQATLEPLSERSWVHANVALIAAGATDDRLRELAVSWSDRVVALLTPVVGRTRAVAIDNYFDGVTMHAAVNETPISETELTQVIRALMSMPVADDDNETRKEN